MAALLASVLSIVPLADQRTWQLLVTSLCFVAALLAAAVVVALVKRWRRRREAEEDVSPNAQLAQFRSLYEAGTISQEEFERLRALLAAQMRESLGVPRPAPPAQVETKRPTDKPDTGIRPA